MLDRIKQIKIPEGYRLVRVGESCNKGFLFYDESNVWKRGCNCDVCINRKINTRVNEDCYFAKKK